MPCNGSGLGKRGICTTRATAAFANQPTQEQLAFFEKKIRPVLVDHCYKCHSAEAEKVKGELLLDTREGVRKGGDERRDHRARQRGASLLIEALRSKDPDTAMPPKGKLPDAVVADFEAWVKMGAPDPRDGKAAVASKVRRRYREGPRFWAFLAAQEVTPFPDVKEAEWPQSQIDAFLLAGLDKKGSKPSATPTSARSSAGCTSTSPACRRRRRRSKRSSRTRRRMRSRRSSIELLASPRFGERWGRHWLDVARYAETTGKTVNMNYPHAWRYRDYVIAAFNADKPYDQFIKRATRRRPDAGGDREGESRADRSPPASSRSARRRSTNATAPSSNSTWPTSRST